jgi:hypothetical protein
MVSCASRMPLASRVLSPLALKPCALVQKAADSFLRLITLATYLRLVLGSNQPMTYYTRASITGRTGILTTNKSSVRNVRLLYASKSQTCHPVPHIAAPNLN